MARYAPAIDRALSLMPLMTFAAVAAATAIAASDSGRLLLDLLVLQLVTR